MRRWLTSNKRWDMSLGIWMYSGTRDVICIKHYLDLSLMPTGTWCFICLGNKNTLSWIYYTFKLWHFYSRLPYWQNLIPSRNATPVIYFCKFHESESYCNENTKSSDYQLLDYEMAITQCVGLAFMCKHNGWDNVKGELLGSRWMVSFSKPSHIKLILYWCHTMQHSAFNLIHFPFFPHWCLSCWAD